MTAAPTEKSSNPIQIVETVYGKEGLDQDGVKIITAAPDVEGVMDCIADLTKRGVTVSIGHRQVVPLLLRDVFSSMLVAVMRVWKWPQKLLTAEPG